MNETTRLPTPDNVELEFRLAGPGSRFLALMIDWLISGSLYAGLIIILVVSGYSFSADDAASSWVMVLILFAFFLIRWGYYLFFEITLRGQTPGKRALGIRVVRRGGLPLGIRHSLIRNLLRVVDSFPPPLCIVGGISVLATRRGQRLGDLAAGTVVIRERFRARKDAATGSTQSAAWVSRLEQGLSRTPVVLPHGQVTIAQIALMEEYFHRVSSLGAEQRASLSWRIAQPLLPLFDKKPEEWEAAEDRVTLCESLLQEILELSRQAAPGARQTKADEPSESPAAARKARMWDNFARQTDALLRSGRRGIARLQPSELKDLLVEYRTITSDLARAQSMGADPGTLDRLNKLAISGHVLIYGYARPKSRVRGWKVITAFPRAVRANAWAVALSSLLFFLPAIISSIAVRVDPTAAYDLVGPEFYDFRPASNASIHSFPPLMRPVVASQVMTNNLQVAIIAFASGLTAGVGTAYVLMTNGIHVGAVIGWMGMHGQASSLWGWIMPHGGTEILAIIIAGAAGLLIAKALLSPGPLKRSAALRLQAMRALVLELGCMGMLVVAGIVEGFVSPSSLGLAPRLVFASALIIFWGLFFVLAGSREKPPVVEEEEGARIR